MQNKKVTAARRRSDNTSDVPVSTSQVSASPSSPSSPSSQQAAVLKTPYRAKFVRPQGWTDDDLKFLFVSREDGLDYYLLASALKRPISEIKKVWRNTNWELSDWFDYSTQKIKNAVFRSERARIVEAREKKYAVEKTRTDFIVDEMSRIINPYPTAPAVWRPSQKPKVHQPEDIVLLLSDLHIGHNHTLQETNGLSEYNPEVFLKRVNNLKKSTADIVELHSKLYDTPTLHIACLGDVVDGMNATGEWSAAYIGLPVYDQWQLGCEAIAEMIYYWLGLFDNINFYGIRGNHARSAPKGVEKDYVNWDLLIYKHLELLFKNEKRVTFNVPPSWYIFTTIRKHKFLMVHGDEIAAAGSPVMKLQECESRMMGLLREIPDYTVAGHFHNSAEMATNHGKVILNGCFLPNVKVQLSNGIKIPISEVQIGDSVIGKKLRSSYVENVKNKQYDGQINCFRVTGNSDEVKCTPNHEFLAIKRSSLMDIPVKVTEQISYNPFKDNYSSVKPDFIRADALSVGDYVALSYDNSLDVDGDTFIKTPFGEIEVTKDVARLIGLYLAEGSSAGDGGKNHHSTWTFSSNEKSLVEFTKETLKKSFKVKVSELRREHKSIHEVVVNNTLFANWIVSFCGKGCSNKKLSSEVLSWPTSLQEMVLSGYLEGDGHAATINKNSAICYMSATVSSQLRDQLQLIALNCGYSPRIRKQSPGGRHKKTSYWLFFNGSEALKLSSLGCKTFNANECNRSNYSDIKCGEYKLRRISQAWTENYSGKVWDLQVGDQESFNVEGLICHNSFIGSDVYSLKSLQRGCKPVQKIFGVHDTHGITWTYDINLKIDR